MHGYEPDLAACYRDAAVVVVPVRSGGGMRGKVLEACAAECAVVSTPTGVDGIALSSGTHCLLAETREQFAAAVVRYLRDAALRTRHGAAAGEVIRDLYDAPRVFTRLERDYEAARAEKSSNAARPQRVSA